ncbi:DUF2170 family protein [Caulobacter sp. SSI4214]|jgi:uncharacterized protein YjfI (DUF2170 family)|uniref:YjfI family protein n=1 Tax=Caulobacter sp. SSI4214 TaxID=2575739 RepID=UPI0014390E40|nr:DUF2170 family protein [Caulobacter sp. SSI4214]
MPAKITRGAQAAERTRAWREARRQAGFVKIEVWAPAACKPDILSAVQAIVVESVRGPALRANPNPPRGVRHMDSVIDTAWTIKSLRDALVETNLVREGEMSAAIIEGVEPVLLVTMHEFGDLPVYVSGGALQMVASTILWPCDEQNDRSAFNEFLLKAQKVVPLSNFGITTIDGRDYYELMGEISSKTTLQTLVIELRTLAANAIAAASDLRETFEKSRVAAA